MKCAKQNLSRQHSESVGFASTANENGSRSENGEVLY